MPLTIRDYVTIQQLVQFNFNHSDPSEAKINDCLTIINGKNPHDISDTEIHEQFGCFF